MDSVEGLTNSSDSAQEDFVPASGMFCGSHHFTVAGGAFTNITKNYTSTSAPIGPSGFRLIPLGDIDLQREILLDHRSGVVNRQQGGRGVRRLYSAKIHGQNSSMTVAIYQGNGAKEEWWRDIATYIHPNLIQIHGGASSGLIHGTLFHADLIPLEDFLDLYRHSPIVTAYIWGSSYTEFRV
ncbi:hypothetical protein B0H19DRAFT_1275926 [Mycena capillaripes]|nr:hypothetical protein B0H19DRAFT_1275926 [Mycena capillaripes]